MSYSNSIIFGPVPSRRFGISLGIDLSPSKKQCNFDCLYCELQPAKTVSKMDTFPSVDEIISSLKSSLKNCNNIDVITLTCNGEPTLYPYLDNLVDRIDEIKGDIKTLILSNGSTIYKDEVFKTLLKIDIVKLSLDCVSEKCFKKLDRQDKSVKLDRIIPSMIEFSKLKNSLILEILFVKGLNDNDDELKLLYEAVKKISPSRVDIGTIDRPPAYKVQGVDYSFLEKVANLFENINVNIVYKNRPSSIQKYTKVQILETLKRRALTPEDVENMFDESSKKTFYDLLESREIGLFDVSGVKFYKIS